MADQSPPPAKPKPGSLRDRIAAFEKPSAGSAQGPVPAPRPKPGGLSWKPRSPSPPSVQHAADGAHTEKKSGGMSATDAKESIGKAGSLKERMAALQGRGGFGAPSPPVAPKPATERPKWKPPPAVSPPVDDEDKKSADTDETPTLPPIPVVSPDVASVQSPDKDQEARVTESEEPVEVDAEEEERQRRANLAARMARLGGARLGMGPPVFGQQGHKKPEIPKHDEPSSSTCYIIQSDRGN